MSIKQAIEAPTNEQLKALYEAAKADPRTELMGDEGWFVMGAAMVEHHFNAALAALRSMPVEPDEEKLLRELLAIRVAGAKLYGDDGELQDNSVHPFIDFKRDSAKEIERKLIDRGMENAWKSIAEYATPHTEAVRMSEAENWRRIYPLLKDANQKSKAAFMETALNLQKQGVQSIPITEAHAASINASNALTAEFEAIEQATAARLGVKMGDV